MKVLVSGASGLIGRAFCARLIEEGHTVGRLVRSAPDPDPAAREVFWKPADGKIDPAGMEGYDGVVHLAGENIASGRWDELTRRRIRGSRVKGTRLVAETLGRLQSPPRVLVCASGSGYYGSRGNEVLTEESPPGKGFLPDVCREWEGAADPAREAGIRVVHTRFGMVLSTKGGALPKMLPPFKLGIAGKIGPGDQYVPWIAIHDAVGLLVHALTTDSLSGPVNATSPNPVTNSEFTSALGDVLHRPTFAMLPSFAARLLFGEMADEILLASCRAVPQRLIESGYRFEFSEIRDALEHVLEEKV